MLPEPVDFWVDFGLFDRAQHRKSVDNGFRLLAHGGELRQK
jgi:hypothetical protein